MSLDDLKEQFKIRLAATGSIDSAWSIIEIAFNEGIQLRNDTINTLIHEHNMAMEGRDRTIARRDEQIRKLQLYKDSLLRFRYR
jgi:hypothetical protein